MKYFPSLLLLICVACATPSSKESSNAINLDSATGKTDSRESNPLVVETSPNSDTALAATKAVLSENNTVDASGPDVYVTHDGDKYHTADCRYSKTAHAVKLVQAKADGKTACGICKPNAKTGEKQLRCTGTTAEGKRCQRMTNDSSGKCFQHRES